VSSSLVVKPWPENGEGLAEGRTGDHVVKGILNARSGVQAGRRGLVRDRPFSGDLGGMSLARAGSSVDRTQALPESSPPVVYFIVSLTVFGAAVFLFIQWWIGRPDYSNELPPLVIPLTMDPAEMVPEWHRAPNAKAAAKPSPVATVDDPAAQSPSLRHPTAALDQRFSVSAGLDQDRLGLMLGPLEQCLARQAGVVGKFDQRIRIGQINLLFPNRGKSPSQE